MQSTNWKAPGALPSGSIYFPLASNAHSLVIGRGVESVRGRLKLASILYDNVVLEAGGSSIQAGPTASMHFVHSPRPGDPESWQTSKERGVAQSGPFALSMASEETPGVPASGPFRQVARSESTISWAPTFDPFARELPSGCNWVHYGRFESLDEHWRQVETGLRKVDDDNEALRRLAPIDFVRSQIVSNTAHDLVTGMSAGVEVSVDSFHGKVISARYAEDASLQFHGFALQLLVPDAARISWDDVAAIRNMKPLVGLRQVLREIEAETFDASISGRELAATVQAEYRKRLAAAALDVESVGAVALFGTAQLVIGSAVGLATMSLSYLGALIGAAPGVAATGLEIGRAFRAGRRRSWIGVTEAIASAARK